jgi:hypothetical protein
MLRNVLHVLELSRRASWSYHRLFNLTQARGQGHCLVLVDPVDHLRLHAGHGYCVVVPMERAHLWMWLRLHLRGSRCSIPGRWKTNGTCIRGSRRYGSRGSIPGRCKMNGTCTRGRLHAQGIIFDPLPHHSIVSQSNVKSPFTERSKRWMDTGKYRVYSANQQPDSSRTCTIQASAEESPIVGVGGSN